MLRSWMLGGLGGMLIASVVLARPGVVKTRDGQLFKGEITEQGDQIIIEVKGIRTRIAQADVRSIMYADSIDQEMRKRLAKLTAYDVRGRIEIAQWLFENKAYDLSHQVLEDARRIQPRNMEVAQLMYTVDRQLELEQHEARKHRPVELAAADNNPRTGGADRNPPARGNNAPGGAAGRLLTPDEINEIRQNEWQQGQPIRVRFEDDVRRKFIARQGTDPAEFNRLTPAQQAWLIIHNGTDEMRRDVILGDPPAMQQYKIVQRSLVAGCAQCHTQGKTQGEFALHWPAESDAATYTNFLILQKYAYKQGNRSYSMIDRERPDDSGLIQFAVPPDVGDPPHPDAPNYRGVVRTKNDPRLRKAADWISSLNPITPDYSDIDIGIGSAGAGAGAPASRPARAPQR